MDATSLATFKVRKWSIPDIMNQSINETTDTTTASASGTYLKLVQSEHGPSSTLTSQSLEHESAELKAALPEDLYVKVCRTLNIPITEILPDPKYGFEKDTHPLRRYRTQIPLLSFRKSFTVEKELDSDTDVELSLRIKETTERHEDNIHHEFLQKGVREQVTWPSHYLQPEREDEKGLVKRANDLTDRIAEEFCDYMRELGGDKPSQLFTPKAIKELFQVEANCNETFYTAAAPESVENVQFDTHASRGLRVVPHELPAVPDAVAEATGVLEKSRKAILEREIRSDIRAESRPSKLEAFGRPLPALEQWKAPQNNTRQLWRSARHIPKDLVTLKTVWEGITNLRSVKEYCRWMIDHPEFRRPPFLKSMGMFDETTLNARVTVESVPQVDQSGRAVSGSVDKSA